MSSLYFDGQRSRWVFSFQIIKSGKVIRKRKFFKEKGDAEKFRKVQERGQVLLGKVCDFDLGDYNRLKYIEGQLTHGTLEDAVYRHNLVSKLSAEATVAEAVKRHLEHKKEIGVSPEWVTTLSGYFKHLCKRFKGNANDLKPEAIRKWLSSSNLSPETKNNIIRALRSFGKFLVSEKLAEQDPSEGVGFYIVPPTPIQFISAIDCERLFRYLQGHRPDLIPFNALRAFAGVRTGHVEKLSWDAIDFGEQGIRMTAGGKMLNDFLQGFPPNLWAWLKRYRGQPLNRYNSARETGKVIRELGISYPKNGFRHAFATFHLSKWRDSSLTSYLLGHRRGANLLHRNYAGLTTQAEARKYFDIL